MWQADLFMLLSVLLTIIFIVFTIKAFRWGNRKSFIVMLIFNIFLAIFSFLVISGYYKEISQPLIVPTSPPPPGYDYDIREFRTSLFSWAELALVSEILSIVTFVIGLVYYFKKRPKIKKTYKEEKNA